MRSAETQGGRAGYEGRRASRLSRGCTGRNRGASSVQGRGRENADWRVGRGEQRTGANMMVMSVTPETSQLRGWLKAFAPCRGPRVASMANTVGGGRRRAIAACTQRAGERAATADICGRGAGSAQRTHATLNIQRMLLTREVSQLSGWLKAVACCRGSQAGHTVRTGYEPGGGRPGGRARRARCVPGRGL